MFARFRKEDSERRYDDEKVLSESAVGGGGPGAEDEVKAAAAACDSAGAGEPDAVEEAAPRPAGEQGGGALKAPGTRSQSAVREADAELEAEGATEDEVHTGVHIGDATDEENLDEVFAPSAFKPRKFVQSSPGQPRRSSKALKKSELKRGTHSPQQRLLLLDTWLRSGLPAKDFADLVGVSKHTLYKWKQQFEKYGPEGVMDQTRQPRRGSRLPEVTKRTILMLKEQHPDWGCQRISDVLVRGPGLSASAQAVSRVLKEAGYESVSQPTSPHPPAPRRFERAAPNQLWQTDLFTFMLKRQNRRLYLVAFMDDHSRFIVSYGLHATASTALVLDVLEAGIANYGAPKEILTDNGPQYKTWRGKSRFTRHLEKRGIQQIVARPKRPQTLGKIERFWGTLWRELLEGAVFQDLADARTRAGLYLDHYNFLRTHHGCDGLVPADRFFAAAEPVRQALAARVAANALELAQRGRPTQSFYVAGQVSGQPFSVHAEGERLVLQREGEERQEVELTRPASPSEDAAPQPICPHAAPASGDGEPAEAAPPVPGTSALDEHLMSEASDWRLDEQDSEAAADDHRCSSPQGGDV